VKTARPTQTAAIALQFFFGWAASFFPNSGGVELGQQIGEVPVQLHCVR
jgi:hypothetical protein